MGQRLNLEIRKKNQVLANAYYHWSAYTGSAYALALDAIERLKRADTSNSKLLAIRALESTGAGLTEDDMDYMKTLKTYSKMSFKRMKDRNEGILSVSPSTIKETQNWAEGTCILHIDNLNDIKVEFDVVSFYNDINDYIEWCDLDDDAAEEFKKNIKKVSYNGSPFSEQEFYEVMNLVLHQGEYVQLSDGTIISELA